MLRAASRASQNPPSSGHRLLVTEAPRERRRIFLARAGMTQYGPHGNNTQALKARPVSIERS
jgi:hypothetical protein